MGQQHLFQDSTNSLFTLAGDMFGEGSSRRYNKCSQFEFVLISRYQQHRVNGEMTLNEKLLIKFVQNTLQMDKRPKKLTNNGMHSIILV